MKAQQSPRARGSTTGADSSLKGSDRPRQGDDEDRALRRPVAVPDLAAVGAGELTGDEQPEPGADHLGRGLLTAGEPLEQVLTELVRYAGPAVLDLDLDQAVGSRDR